MNVHVVDATFRYRTQLRLLRRSLRLLGWRAGIARGARRRAPAARMPDLPQATWAGVAPRAAGHPYRRGTRRPARCGPDRRLTPAAPQSPTRPRSPARTPTPDWTSAGRCRLVARSG